MIIYRYLTREVYLSLCGITLVLLLAFLSQQVVRYLNFVAIGKIPTSLLLELVSFEIPYLLALLLPLGLYLGVLLSYGKLYANQEMAVLKMCGFGDQRLIKLTLTISLVIFLLVLFLMTIINPLISAKRQQVMTSDEATVHLIERLLPGQFQVSPDGHHVMYVEKLSRDRQRAENVFLAKEKKNVSDEDHSDWMLVLASQGYQVNDEESKDKEQLFVARGGYRYEGTPGQNDYKIIQFDKYSIRIPDNEARITQQESEALPTMQLLHEYANPKRAAEFEWRVSIAISALILALIAVPFSQVSPRKGRYLTLLPAIMFYILYINLLFIARHWVDVGKVSIAFGMWWVHGVMLVLFAILYLLRSTSFRFQVSKWRWRGR